MLEIDIEVFQVVFDSDHILGGNVGPDIHIAIDLFDNSLGISNSINNDHTAQIAVHIHRLYNLHFSIALLQLGLFNQSPNIFLIKLLRQIPKHHFNSLLSIIIMFIIIEWIDIVESG